MQRRWRSLQLEAMTSAAEKIKWVVFLRLIGMDVKVGWCDGGWMEGGREGERVENTLTDGHDMPYERRDGWID